MATMTHVTTSEIDSELQARGYRLTPRRLMVVEVLASHGGHLTVDEILSEVAARHPSTNKTTVYRTLEPEQPRMVAITDLGMGRLEYELQRHPHHHLICEGATPASKWKTASSNRSAPASSNTTASQPTWTTSPSSASAPTVPRSQK